MREIRPSLTTVTSLIDIIVGCDVDDIGVLRMKLDENDGIATIAAGKRESESENGKEARHEVDVTTIPVTYSS